MESLEAEELFFILTIFIIHLCDFGVTTYQKQYFYCNTPIATQMFRKWFKYFYGLYLIANSFQF